MEHKLPSELRLIARAVRENWPMSALKRREAIEQLRAAVADPTTRRKTRDAVARALSSALHNATAEK